MSQAQNWRASVLGACEKAAKDLFAVGDQQIADVEIDSRILWIEFKDGSRLFAHFMSDHTGLKDDDLPS